MLNLLLIVFSRVFIYFSNITTSRTQLARKGKVVSSYYSVIFLCPNDFPLQIFLNVKLTLLILGQYYSNTATPYSAVLCVVCQNPGTAFEKDQVHEINEMNL